jgi:hypothetical protein
VVGVGEDHIDNVARGAQGRGAHLHTGQRTSEAKLLRRLGVRWPDSAWPDSSGRDARRWRRRHRSAA